MVGVPLNAGNDFGARGDWLCQCRSDKSTETVGWRRHPIVQQRSETNHSLLYTGTASATPRRLPTSKGKSFFVCHWLCQCRSDKSIETVGWRRHPIVQQRSEANHSLLYTGTASATPRRLPTQELFRAPLALSVQETFRNGPTLLALRSPVDVPGATLPRVDPFEKGVVHIDTTQPISAATRLPLSLFDRLEQFAHGE